MTKPLNQHGLRFNIGKGTIQTGNRITVKNEKGEKEPGKSVPVYSFGTASTMLDSNSKNDREKFDIDPRESKGGGEYSVSSTHSTFLSTKLQYGEEITP